VAFMTYKETLTQAMTWLGRRNDTIFVGQAVAYPGTFMNDTLAGVPAVKKLEMPVAEQFQLQFCIGLAQAGYLPICIYPRQNFMLYALGDIVNVLDKLNVGRVIVRVASGTTKPVFPGVQHVGDYSSPISNMLDNVDVLQCRQKDLIMEHYKDAIKSKRSSIIVEYGDAYGS